MGELIVARHHESQWNKEGLWTGSRDVHLTQYGFDKSREMGKLIQDIRIDYAFASMQVRSIETLSSMLEACALQVPTEHAAALNERDYGAYTGKNKWDMQALVGEEVWEKIRREWDYPIPGGETLKMVYERVVPFFIEHILPKLQEGKNVLVVSHGNALRALMMYIESIAPGDAAKVEMLFGAVVRYTLTHEGHMIQKQVRAVESTVHA